MLLRDLQHTLSAVWTNKYARKRFLIGRQGRVPGDERGRESAPLVLDIAGLELYADLIRYGYLELMSSVYPACERLIGKETFEGLVDRYFAACPPAHYHLNSAAGRFPEYLADREAALIKQYPFLTEVADYEWTELELLENPTEIEFFPYAAPSTLHDLESTAPVLNPVLATREYLYRIPAMVEQLLEQTPGAASRRQAREPALTRMAIFRHPQSHEVKFLELGNVAAGLVTLMQDGLCSYLRLAEELTSQCPGVPPLEFITSLLGLIGQLQSSGLLIGTIRLSKEAS